MVGVIQRNDDGRGAGGDQRGRDKPGQYRGGSRFDWNSNAQRNRVRRAVYAESEVTADWGSWDGTANDPVLAPRITSIAEITGHALMLHVGGDNHSDVPNPLGGGGDRMACGVI